MCFLKKLIKRDQIQNKKQALRKCLPVITDVQFLKRKVVHDLKKVVPTTSVFFGCTNLLQINILDLNS